MSLNLCSLANQVKNKRGEHGGKQPVDGKAQRGVSAIVLAALHGCGGAYGVCGSAY